MMRQQQQQDLHDIVIEKIAKMLEEEHGSTYVHTNPGSQKNFDVDGRWPDVVLVDSAGGARSVFEVETEDTVVMAHAEEKWVDYAELGVPFYLVVPEQYMRETKRIVRALALQVEKLFLY